MREALGPYLASLTQARRRRVLRILLAAMLAVFGLIAWSNYPAYRSDHRFLANLERGRINVDELFRNGITCDDTSCQFLGRDGQPVGPKFPSQSEPVPAPGGGSFFKGPGATITPEQVRQQLPELIPAFRAELAKTARLLTPRASFQAHARTLGTFWGVLFIVLIASTLIGAEWRWGVWPALLTHEPRRGRMVLAKLATVWTIVGFALVLVLGFTAGLDVIFRHISSVGARGGPSPLGLARMSGKALLSLEVYATFAAALTMMLRTSMGGIGSFLLLLGDGLATRKWTWFRLELPTQQIARLIPSPIEGIGRGYVWFPSVYATKSSCQSTPEGFRLCQQIPLPPIPLWRAVAVLFAWIATASLLAWLVMRRRDAPQ